MSKEKGDEGSTGSEDEIIGYRQQPGKLPFSRPGSGGKNRFSESTKPEMIPSSQGGSLKQPWGPHRHDELVSGQIIGKLSNNKQQILIREIDYKKIDNVREHWPFLRDRRIDFYKGILK